MNIFNKIEFDENGTVISVEENNTLNKIEFDENGTVIAVNGDTLNIETTLSIPDSDLFECFRLSINNKGTLSFDRIYIEYEE